jgi:cytochrome c-type biogenesis protein CcmH/NrfG
MFFLLLLVVIAPYVRLLRLGGKDDHRQLTLSRNGLFLVAVFGVLAHNLIDFNLQFVGIALPFWMMLGALASTHTGGRTGKGIFMHTKFVHKLELVVAVVLLTVALREGGFLITSSLGRHAEEARNTEAALRWYDRSTAEWFSRDMHLSRALLTTTQTETDRAQEAMDTFLRLNAEDPRGWRLQGDIARLKGDAVAAVDAYAKAYELGRWNDLSITLALVEVLREEDESSLVSMKPHIDALLGSFVEAIVLNAHFVALSHNAEDAIALSALLAEQFPDSAPRYEVLAARADFAMRTERAKVTSRPAGYLW